jgi:hypothetical protein
MRCMRSGRSRVNYKLHITHRALRFTHYVLLLVLLVGCTTHFDAETYTAVAGWLDAHALPSERIAAPEALAQRLTTTDRPVMTLPEGDDATVLMTTLRTECPDYVIAWSGVAWDGAQAHPWFQEHYRFLDTLPVSDSTLTSLRIYGYAPSPFDQGVWQPVQQSFAGLDLRAVRVSRQRLIPGDPFYVTLAWGGDLFALPDAQRLVLRLMDVASHALRVQVEYGMLDGLPPDLFRDGDNVTSRYTLAIPDDLEYGNYTLTLTLYRRNGAPVAGENLPLATLYYPPEVTYDRPVPEFEGAWSLGDAVALIGYDVPERVSPGDTLRVTLYWHARAAVSGDYKVFVHLLDVNGVAVAQDDNKPVGWTYPTTHWEPGQYVRDEHILTLDESTARGDYALFVGMYDPDTGVRVDVTDTQGTLLPDGRAMLRVVTVR